MDTPHFIHILRSVILDTSPADGTVEAGHVSLLTQSQVFRVLQAELAEVSTALVTTKWKEVSSPARGTVKTNVLEFHCFFPSKSRRRQRSDEIVHLPILKYSNIGILYELRIGVLRRNNREGDVEPYEYSRSFSNSRHF